MCDVIRDAKRTLRHARTSMGRGVSIVIRKHHLYRHYPSFTAAITLYDLSMSSFSPARFNKTVTRCSFRSPPSSPGAPLRARRMSVMTSFSAPLLAPLTAPYTSPFPAPAQQFSGIFGAVSPVFVPPPLARAMPFAPRTAPLQPSGVSGYELPDFFLL